jgi:hypothetical protein
MNARKSITAAAAAALAAAAAPLAAPALADGGVDDQQASAEQAERAESESMSEAAGDAAVAAGLAAAGQRCCGVVGAIGGAALGAVATHDGGESPDIGHGDSDPSGANPTNEPGGGGFGTSNDMM